MAILIIFIFIVLLLWRYEYALCAIFALTPVLYELLFSGSLSIFHVLTAVAFLIFLFRRKKIVAHKEKFPFVMVTVLAVLSQCLTNFASTSPHWPSAFGFIIVNYLVLIPFWYIIQNRRNQSFFIRCMLGMIVVVEVYALFESSVGYNPFFDWLSTTSMNMYGGDGESAMRLDMVRCHSIIAGSGAFGLYCSLAFCFVFALFQQARSKSNRFLDLLLMILSVVGVFLTVSRSCIAALGVGVVLIILFSKIKLRYKLVFVALALVGMSLSGSFFDAILNSFVDTESVQGSNTDMRAEQLAITLQVASQHPFLGDGIDTAANAMEIYRLLYGAESVWFQLLMNFGILGVIALVYNFISYFRISFKRRNIIAVAAVAIYLVNKTLTTAPGIDEGFYMMLVMFLLFYNSNKKANEVNRYHHYPSNP